MTVPRPRLHTQGLLEELAAIKRELRQLRVRTNLGVPQSYTPTLTATTTNPTNWTLSGLYWVIGQIVGWELTAVASTGFTIGSGTYLFSLPFPTGIGNIIPVGIGEAANTGYSFIATVDTSTGSTSKCRLVEPGIVPIASLTHTGPYGNAWALNNTVRLNGQYRIAAT